MVGCAGTQSYAGMLASRALLGVGGSTFSTLCGGVIADIYHAESRGFPMACFSTLALFGTGAGPLVSGFIAQRLNWRWIHWTQAIVNGMLLGAAALLLKETRGSVLLTRRMKALNTHLNTIEASLPEKEITTRRVRWKVLAEEERGSLSNMVRVSLTRPFHLLFTEPVVFFFSLWVAFSWGILYLCVFYTSLVTFSDRPCVQLSPGSSACIPSLPQLRYRPNGSRLHIHVRRRSRGACTQRNGRALGAPFPSCGFGA
jgi:MFS family permease